MTNTYHLPCPDCGSSDALTEYDDHTYCFACRKRRGKGGYRGDRGRDKSINNKVIDYSSLKDYNKYLSTTEDCSSNLSESYLGTSNLSELSLGTLKGPLAKKEERLTKDLIDYRGILADTFKFYGCYFRSLDGDTPVQLVMPYGKQANKVRSLKEKKFHSEGVFNTDLLFGMDKFPTGKYITILEGELDAMSCYQMSGSKYPCVSVRSSSSARKDCEATFKYLNSFERIYLCFDSDEPGQKAVKEVASLFDPNKVYHVHLNRFKDANEYLLAGAKDQFLSEWWNAKPYLPKGIVGDYASIKDILKKEDASSIASYPYRTLQSMTYGIRSKEVILLTAQEKIGKTEVLRSFEHHLLKTTDYNTGIIHLEESEKRSIQGLVGYELQVPVHLPDSNITLDETILSYQKLTKRDNRCFFYSHFGSDDPQVILDMIRYMVVACHCKFIFLDHITMLVTGFQNEDERKTLDFLSTHLGMMTRELDFTLFLVSHVNDDGKTRGSRNISKIADLLLHLDRDIESSSTDERNKTHLLIKGNRFASHSGPAGTLWFDPVSFTLKELNSGEEHILPIKEEAQRDTLQAMESSDSRPSSLWVQDS